MGKIVITSPVTGLFAQFGPASEAGLKAAADVLYDEWHKLLNKRKGSARGVWYGNEFRTIKRGGRSYVVPTGRRKEHQASAPDDPPAKDTQRLAKSLFKAKIEGGWRIGSSEWHALFLEYGIGPGYPFKHPASQFTKTTIYRQGGSLKRGPRTTKTGYAVAPRPHLRPAMAAALPKMNTQMVAAMRTAVSIPIKEIDLLKVRRGLFAFSATIGNLQALGIRLPFMNVLRQGALRLERGTGDFDAFISGKLDQRVVGRVVGRQFGRTLGNVTRGIPGRFPKRVARRVLSKNLTTPALRKVLSGF